MQEMVPSKRQKPIPVTQRHIAEKQNPQSHRYKNLRTRQRY
jgi:hypothetical protein